MAERPTVLWRAGRVPLALALAVGAAAGASAEQSHMLVVAGLGGEPAYVDAFRRAAAAAAERGRAFGAKVTVLADESAGRDGIRRAIADIADSAREADSVVAHFIGHGSYDGEHYRFNVPGPDPTAADLAAWLEPLPRKRLVILTTSAAGAGLDALLTGTGAVITATRDGRETNAVVFHRFWTEALQARSADVNKDQRISAEEAFQHTASAVAAHYERAGRIATEHPRLEGAAAPFTVAVLGPARPQPPADDPAVARLVERSETLTRRIDELKAARKSLAMEDYFAQLQELLLELAVVERDLKRSRDGADGQPPPSGGGP